MVIDGDSFVDGGLVMNTPLLPALRAGAETIHVIYLDPAVKAIVQRCDALVVIGAPNSSNSMRLVEVAASHGCARSRLVQRAADMDWAWLEGVRRLGITAGASAPETLVDELVAACRERYDVTVEEVRTIEENVVFKLPRSLVA